MSLPEYRNPDEYAVDPATGKFQVIRHNPTSFYVRAGHPMIAYQIGPQGGHFFTPPPNATYIPEHEVPEAVRRDMLAHPPTAGIPPGGSGPATLVTCKVCAKVNPDSPPIVSTEYADHLERHLIQLQQGTPLTDPQADDEPTSQAPIRPAQSGPPAHQASASLARGVAVRPQKPPGAYRGKGQPTRAVAEALGLVQSPEGHADGTPDDPAA